MISSQCWKCRGRVSWVRIWRIETLLFRDPYVLRGIYCLVSAPELSIRLYKCLLRGKLITLFPRPYTSRVKERCSPHTVCEGHRWTVELKIIWTWPLGYPVCLLSGDRRRRSRTVKDSEKRPSRVRIVRRTFFKPVRDTRCWRYECGFSDGRIVWERLSITSKRKESLGSVVFRLSTCMLPKCRSSIEES